MNRRKTEAVILDWAGTTVDYGCFAPVQAFITAFEEYGITPTLAEVREPMGMLKRDHVRTMMNMERIRGEWKRVHGRDFTEADVEQVYQTSEKSILRIVHRFADPKPHVLEVVRKLREEGIRIGSTTGYTDEMMRIVVPAAAEKGYSPDCWFSPNSVGNFGRPYPYMIFENLKKLEVTSVAAAVKVGDTVSDIKEGLAAGMPSLGILEGSSAMGLTEEEYEALPAEEKERLCGQVREKFLAAGATAVLRNLSELPAFLEELDYYSARSAQ